MFKPKYQITKSVARDLREIEKLRDRTAHAKILPTHAAEIRQRASVEATHSSTSIEGNPLSFQEVRRVLDPQNHLTPVEYAEIEVANYKQALDFIAQRKQLPVVLEAKDILWIHRLVTDRLLAEDRSGRWRQNMVFIEDQDHQVQYTAAEVAVITEEMEELVRWLELDAASLHPVVAAALLHLQLVAIHPFADGNGRTARILTLLYLGLRQYDFEGALVLDSYYSSDRKGYYQALQQGHGATFAQSAQCDLTKWLEYFVKGFLSSVRMLDAEIKIMAALGQKQNAPVALSVDETDLLSYAREFGSITLAEAQSILPHLSRRSVQRKLNHLVQCKFLRLRGATKGARYAIIKKK